MISLGGSSTYLQNQVISGFDSVAQGFTAAATTTGATALQTAQDSFSSFDANETTALASMGSQQTISGVAEFSSPATYLKREGIQANEPVLRAFQDPSLASGGDLSSISEILSKVTADAEQNGIIIVSGSPTQLQQRASTKLEQAGVITPPQVGGSTKLEQAGVLTPPQFGGSPTQLQQQASSQLEQAGVITPPQVGGSTKLEQAGVLTPPQFGGSPTQLQQQASSQLEQAGVITPPQVGGSTKLEQAGVLTPPQFGAFDAITFSPQQTTALSSMSKTVREAASLFQNVNVSMLGRKIVG
jgi:hypothetical protein